MPCVLTVGYIMSISWDLPDGTLEHLNIAIMQNFFLFTPLLRDILGIATPVLYQVIVSIIPGSWINVR